MAAIAAIAVYIGVYLVQAPASAVATQGPSGVQLHLATVAAAETTDPHPTWVSYYSTDANDQNWRHATTYVLPAHTLVHVTVYEFDSQTGLRNPFLSQPQGATSGSYQVDGKSLTSTDPSVASHIFAVPQIGLSIPLPGISSSAKNPCSNAPCPLSTAHVTITFTFRTPGKGLYRWQCFVPCGAGFIDGNGGPMQTVGYMDGFLHVV
ncbi:MAG TPA: hypothetical protein VFN48_01030 [Solirubrobacteraceae bacterium]|nr:hypothetical protein [Solirubrobacteraceae bacterium]